MKPRQRQAVDGRGFARYAVVVHRVHAVGGDVHLVKRAIAHAKIEYSLDCDPA